MVYIKMNILPLILGLSISAPAFVYAESNPLQEQPSTQGADVFAQNQEKTPLTHDAPAEQTTKQAAEEKLEFVPLSHSTPEQWMEGRKRYLSQMPHYTFGTYAGAQSRSPEWIQESFELLSKEGQEVVLRNGTIIASHLIISLRNSELLGGTTSPMVQKIVADTNAYGDNICKLSNLNEDLEHRHLEEQTIAHALEKAQRQGYTAIMTLEPATAADRFVTLEKLGFVFKGEDICVMPGLNGTPINVMVRVYVKRLN